MEQRFSPRIRSLRVYVTLHRCVLSPVVHSELTLCPLLPRTGGARVEFTHEEHLDTIFLLKNSTLLCLSLCTVSDLSSFWG